MYKKIVAEDFYFFSFDLKETSIFWTYTFEKGGFYFSKLVSTTFAAILKKQIDEINKHLLEQTKENGDRQCLFELTETFEGQCFGSDKLWLDLKCALHQYYKKENIKIEPIHEDKFSDVMGVTYSFSGW